MPTIPDSTKASLHHRLIDNARERWPQLSEIRLRYRAGFAYVDGVLADGEVLRLCRLRYGGSAQDWGFAMYRASHDDYEDSFLPTGFMGGAPEDALDTACGLYLADPTGWTWTPDELTTETTRGNPAAVRLAWSEPCDLQGLQGKVIRPALEAVGLPASRPDGTKGIRLHGFRHTFAVLQLSAGVHFIQVSKWLAHASYVITLTVYADYIPEEGTHNALPEPQAPASQTTDVVNLHRSTAG